MLGRDLHMHHKREHAHNRGRVLRTCESGTVGLELGWAVGSRSQIRARALLLQWAACPGLLGVGGGGRGLEFIDDPDWRFLRLQFDVGFGEHVNGARHRVLTRHRDEPVLHQEVDPGMLRAAMSGLQGGLGAGGS